MLSYQLDGKFSLLSISTLIRLLVELVRVHVQSRWLESPYSAVGEGKVLFSTTAKPGILGLGMAPKENFLPIQPSLYF